MKAVIRKLIDMPWNNFKELFTWPGNGTIQADNPALIVGSATNAKGDVVCYVAAEPILLLSSYVFNTQSTPSEVEAAGDVIDAALAQREGVSKMWITIPDGAPAVKGEKVVRILERQVSQPANVQTKIESDSPSVWVN